MASPVCNIDMIIGDFVEKLIDQGKPVIYATSNPYKELMIPDNARNVIFTGGIMHEQYEALINFLFK